MMGMSLSSEILQTDFKHLIPIHLRHFDIEQDKIK